MTLQDIFQQYLLSNSLAALPVRGVSDDSRLARRGDLFFVIERENFDIMSVLKSVEHKVIAFVLSRQQASAISRLAIRAPLIFVDDVRKEFQRAIDIVYGFNPADFIFIGVTGTKGKTTVAYCIYHLLKQLGQRVSLIGTVQYLIGDRSYDATHTTPDYLTLRKLCKESKEARCAYIIMEVSSHAIAQRRIEGINFEVCIFTNLSREHLDYHKTMQRYFQAKKQLFLDNPKAQMIINGDDRYGRKLLRQRKKVFSYGIVRPAVYRARVLRIDKGGIAFEIAHGTHIVSVTSIVLGKHNVYNILAAVAGVCALGFTIRAVTKNISSFCGVEGRLEEIVPDVFVDYAHTPDSLKKALQTLAHVGYKKIICVFGCGGDRDKGKRKIMGKIAASRADFTFITSDNPRSEDPKMICDAIAQGFTACNYALTVDRKEALKKALRMKRQYTDCCVLVAGKGHENYQIIGAKRFAFKDSVVIRALTKTICS